MRGALTAGWAADGAAHGGPPRPRPGTRPGPARPAQRRAARPPCRAWRLVPTHRACRSAPQRSPPRRRPLTPPLPLMPPLRPAPPSAGGVGAAGGGRGPQRRWPCRPPRRRTGGAPGPPGPGRNAHMPHAARRTPHAARRTSHAACRMPHAARCCGPVHAAAGSQRVQLHGAQLRPVVRGRLQPLPPPQRPRSLPLQGPVLDCATRLG